MLLESPYKQNPSRFHRLLGICFSAYLIYVMVHYLGGHMRAVWIHAAGCLATGVVWLLGARVPRLINLASHLNLGIATLTLSAHAWNGALRNDSAWFLTLIPLFAAYQLGSGAALRWTGVVALFLLALPPLAAHYQPQPEWLLGQGEVNRNRFLLVLFMSAFAVASARATKEEEERASRGEKRLRAVFRQAAQGMVTLSEEGKIESLNDAALEILGLSDAELSLERVMPEFRVGAGGGHATISRDENSVTHVVWSSVLVSLQDRKICSLMLTDITSLKEAELQVLQREQQLKQSNERLEKLNAALEQSNQDLQRFASTASHDLQAPLRRVKSFAQLLDEELKEKIGAEPGRWLDYMGQEVTRMQQLISDLLAFARIESEDQQPQLTDLNQIVEQVKDSLSPHLEKGAVIHSSQLPSVWAKRSLLFRLLLNLVGNGLKYNRSKTPTVEIEAQRDGQEWVVSVRDNGIGVEKAKQEKIFEVFTRLHPSSEYPGSGLGLAICQRIVRAQGGRLFLSSTPGQGSTFSFSLNATVPGQTESPPKKLEKQVHI